MRYAVVNLGCKVNRVESDSFERALADAGAAPAVPEEADLVIVNTCAVTAEAEKKTRKAVRRAVRSCPGTVLVTGCSAVLHEEAYRSLGERVRVVPKGQVASEAVRIAGQVGDCEAPDSCPHAAASGPGDPFSQKPVPRAPGDFAQRARVGVKVQDGCDNACSYCVIHVARGPATSMPAAEIAADCLRLLGEGVREIVLTGINLGTYRWQQGGATLRLHDLLERLLALADGAGAGEGADGVPGARFRLSSIEPTDLSPELVALLARVRGRVCRHLHLPLQAGSSKVLEEMNRPYTAEGFREVVAMVRRHLPQVALTTDVIVGFPGETEQDFQETLSLVRYCGFSRVHVFPYSRREGTPAAERADQVPEAVKADRSRRLRALAAELSARDLARRAGTSEWALVEVPGEAMTESYHGVSAPEGARVGELVRVTL